MKATFRTLWQAALLWYDKDADHMAATVSYYALFAFAPLLLITVTFSGYLYGDEYVAHVLLTWGAVLGPDLLALLEQAVQNLDGLSNNFTIPLIGVLFFSGMVIVMFNTFTSGLHKLWGVPHQGVRGWIKKCLKSAYFVFILEAFVLLLIGVDALVLQLQPVVPGVLLQLLDHSITLVTATLMFALAYGTLPWKRLPYRARLYGASVASLLFVIAKLVVSSYVAITPVPGLYGAAGLLLALLIWQYAVSCILYYGAAVAYIRSGGV